MSEAWAVRRGLTAILITVPELAAYTDRWRSVSRSTRATRVPLTELIPPHVTVLVPVGRGAHAESDVQRLTDAVSPFEPFELSFPTAGQFPNGTVWLKPEPFDPVVSLLYSVFAGLPGVPAVRR